MENNTKKFQEVFNQKYRGNQNTFGSIPLPVVTKTLEYISTGDALDLGVGNGRNTLFLLSESFNVTGVDSSEEGIKILKEKVGDNPNLEIILSDVMEYEPTKQYDLILAVGLLHFLKEEDGLKLTKRIQDWTKEGGINVIGAKMRQNIANNLPHVFKHDELKGYYKKDNWDVKFYEERGASFLIAQKLY